MGSKTRADNARHELVEVVFIAVASAICGAEICVEMAEFGLAQEPLFRQVLRLEHGIPSHDTFSPLFRLLDPASFHTAFHRFMASFAEAAGGGWRDRAGRSTHGCADCPVEMGMLQETYCGPALICRYSYATGC